MKFLKKHQKKPIILMEVLIALSIVSLCAFPLLRLPFIYHVNAIETIKSFEFERLSELAWLEILQKITSHDWEKIPKKSKKMQEVSYFLHEVTLDLPGFRKETYQVDYMLWVRRNKDANTKRLIHCKISFKRGSKIVFSSKHTIFGKLSDEKKS